MRGNRVDGAIDAIEVTAAGILAVVTANTFVSVILRYLFSWSIPDSYDFGRLLLGILIFWGIAVTSYRGEHITVDLVWGVAGPKLQRAMDVFANLVTLGAMAVLAWMMGDKVLSTRADHVLTFDLNLPTWIFYLVAWMPIAASIALLVARTIRQILRPETVVRDYRIEAIE
ncbi:MAG: TRAP transporter small permease [Proteobacteria bacterium]|nr:TRAP transporter small permease [Pseudomonadota bacterium]